MSPIVSLFAITAAMLLAACGPTVPLHKVQVEDRSSAVGARKQAPKPEQPAADRPGFYTVQKGDTLYRVSLQVNQPVRSLVEWNKLANPNDIKVGQQLRVAPPEGGQGDAPGVAQAEAVPLDSGLQVLPPAGGAAPAPAKPPAAVTSRLGWPTEGQVISPYDPARKGIDIAGKPGQPVVAAGDGTVLYANSMRGYGNLVILDHSEGMVTAYGHNKTILVKEGQSVTKGQRIAEMGNSDSDTVKLHFEIRQLGKPVDPAGLLPSR